MNKAHAITVLPGDGIGPEVCTAVMKVLAATGAPLEFEVYPIGETAGVPQAAMNSLRRTLVGLKGPTATPIGAGRASLNVQLRRTFELFANVRPVRTMPGITTRFSDVPIDIVIFRENLEDLYIGEESEDKDGAVAISRFTRKNIERLARFAFSWAHRHGRTRVTVVHKANILKKTHGLFLSVAREVAEDYPGIVCDDLIADNCMMQLVQRPERFDCILAPNFLGDLLSDLCAGLVGGLGFAPGANIGETAAIFEAVHGTAPDIAGKGIANPTSLILSGAMMLDYLDEHEAAARLRTAVDQVLLEGTSVTADAGRPTSVGTDAYADAIIGKLQ